MSFNFSFFARGARNRRLFGGNEASWDHPNEIENLTFIIDAEDTIFTQSNYFADWKEETLRFDYITSSIGNLVFSASTAEPWSRCCVHPELRRFTILNGATDNIPLSSNLTVPTDDFTVFGYCSHNSSSFNTGQPLTYLFSVIDSNEFFGVGARLFLSSSLHLRFLIETVDDEEGDLETYWDSDESLAYNVSGANSFVAYYNSNNPEVWVNGQHVTFTRTLSGSGTRILNQFNFPFPRDTQNSIFGFMTGALAEADRNRFFSWCIEQQSSSLDPTKLRWAGYWRADLGHTYENAQTMSYQEHQGLGGSGFDRQMPTAAARPTYYTASTWANNSPAVRYSGSHSMHTSANVWNVSGSQDLVNIILAVSDAPTTANRVLMGTRNRTAGGFGHLARQVGSVTNNASIYAAGGTPSRLAVIQSCSFETPFVSAIVSVPFGNPSLDPFHSRSLQSFMDNHSGVALNSAWNSLNISHGSGREIIWCGTNLTSGANWIWEYESCFRRFDLHDFEKQYYYKYLKERYGLNLTHFMGVAV